MNQFIVSIFNLGHTRAAKLPKRRADWLCCSRAGQSALEYIVLLGALGTLVVFAGPFFSSMRQQADETFVSATKLIIRD
jgi:hypothetical protein